MNRRDLIPESSYRQSIESRAQLWKLRNALDCKLKEVLKWHGDLVTYHDEFKLQRINASQIAVSELLDVFPAKALLKAPKIARLLPSDFEATFMAAYDAVKGVNNVREGLESPPGNSNKVWAGLNSLAKVKSLMLTAGLEKEAEANRYIKLTSKIFECATKIFKYAERVPNKNPEEERREERAARLQLQADIRATLSSSDILSLSTELVETGTTFWLAETAVPLVALEKLISRRGAVFAANLALKDLNRSLSENWNAELHLREKIEKIDSDIAKSESTIGYYCAINSADRDCGMTFSPPRQECPHK